MDEKKKNCDCGCEHDDCDCGCEDIVTLTDDKGNPLKFYHIGTIEFKKAYYAAFQPAEEIDGLEEDEIVIFEVVGTEDGEESELLPIEDQDLLDEVYEEFCKIMESEEDDCDCDDDCDCYHHE